MLSPTSHPILVLDDDPSQSYLMWRALREVGYRVVLVRTAQEAEFRMRGEPFELLVTDHDLPLESGMSFVRRLRTSADEGLGVNRQIPAVMVSGSRDPATIAAVAREGFRAYVEKPFRPAAFARLISQLGDAEPAGFIHLQPFN